MPRFYLAGPMRDIPHHNFPAFAAAAAEGRRLGFEVISPAEADLDSGDLPGGPPEDGAEPDDVFMRAAFGRDTAIVGSLRRENRDGIALLLNWERSGGAATELMMAVCFLRGLRVLNAVTWKPFTNEEIARIDFNRIIERLKAALSKRD